MRSTERLPAAEAVGPLTHKESSMRVDALLAVSLLLTLSAASQAADRLVVDSAATLPLAAEIDDGSRAKGAECNYYGSGIGTTMVCTYQDKSGSCTTVGTPTGSHSIGDHPGCPKD
jgi:hypothetical protein